MDIILSVDIRYGVSSFLIDKTYSLAKFETSTTKWDLRTWIQYTQMWVSESEKKTGRTNTQMAGRSFTRAEISLHKSESQKKIEKRSFVKDGRFEKVGTAFQNNIQIKNFSGISIAQRVGFLNGKTRGKQTFEPLSDIEKQHSSMPFYVWLVKCPHCGYECLFDCYDDKVLTSCKFCASKTLMVEK